MDANANTLKTKGAEQPRAPVACIASFTEGPEIVVQSVAMAHLLGDHHLRQVVDNGGAGLGLAIVVAGVEAHGGSVHLDTTPAHGATVTFALPSPDAPA